MKFAISATAALLLHASVNTAAAAASSTTTSSSATNFLNAFEFGRPPPIQRKRNLVIQTNSTHRMTKVAKDVEEQSSNLLSGSKTSKDGYRLMAKSTKVAATAFSMEEDAVGSFSATPFHKAKAVKMRDMSSPFASGREFSMVLSEFSMPGVPTAAPTPTDGGSGGGGGGDGGGGGGGGDDTNPPTPTPQDPFHEVVFKYLALCSGVELEMDCLTTTAIETLMTQQDQVSRRARARRFLGTDATMPPTDVAIRGSKSSKAPSLSPSVLQVTDSPTVSQVTDSPTKNPVTDPPTVLEATISPTEYPTTYSPTIFDVDRLPTKDPVTAAPVTNAPTRARLTPSPTKNPVTNAPTRSQLTSSPTKSPMTSAPTRSVATNAPTRSQVTPSPTKSPVTSTPTRSAFTPSPTKSPVTSSPTRSAITPSPTNSPTTSPPTELTSSPTNTVTAPPTPSSTDQCRPEVTEDDLLSILTTSRQECIESGTPISNDAFQATLSSFLAIFNEGNTCWNSLCEESDNTSDLFFQILFDQASECADVSLSVDVCILDHILEVVFQSDASNESGARVRRSLQESCCEPDESDLNFYANYLLLSADAACTEQGSVSINNDEWNVAKEDLVKLFGATECWGVDPCEDEVVVSEVESSSSGDLSGVTISDDMPFFHDGPTISDDGEVCTLSPGVFDDELRSLELSFYYQVETTSESVDLGPIERALIALVCDDAGNERRLNEFQMEVVAVDASPEDVVSDEYTCTSSTPGTICQVVKGAITIKLASPVAPNEDTILMAKIASFFPIALDNNEVATASYLATPSTTTAEENASSTSTMSALGISAAATAVVLFTTILIRGATSRRSSHVSVHSEEDANDASKDEYKGQDELTIAATAEITCGSDTSPKHHVVNDEEREHWRDLGMGMEGDLVTI